MAREQWTLGSSGTAPTGLMPESPPIDMAKAPAEPRAATVAPPPASEADALRDDPESGQLLAVHMADAGYQPVILFGNAASGKTSLILSLLAAIRTNASLDAGLFLGDPIIDRSKLYGAYLAEQAAQFFGLKTQQFIEGTAAARTNIDLPFFIPLIFRPSGKHEARLALMESNGEWYRADRQANKFFPPLRQQIEDFLRHYPGGILFIHLLPYTQRHQYTAEVGGSDAAELEEASLAVSGALQAYEAVRVDKSNDRHLLLVTKWDAHRPADLDPVDALYDDPADVAAFIAARYAQAWASFKGLNLRPDQMATNGYCSGQISANNVIKAGPNDDRGDAIRRYPVGLWRWLYRSTLELAGVGPIDPFPSVRRSPFGWMGRLLHRLF